MTLEEGLEEILVVVDGAELSMELKKLMVVVAHEVDILFHQVGPFRQKWGERPFRC